MSKKIEFIMTDPEMDWINHPIPAKKNIPNWYKDLSANIDTRMSVFWRPFTLKKCVPVLDMLLSGYYILNYTDIVIEKDFPEKHEHQPVKFMARSPKETVIDYHNNGQLGNYKIDTRIYYDKVFKWVNYWAIKTPPGYSTLFMQPEWLNLPFEIFPAIVDTDKDHIPTQFPFLLKRDCPKIIEQGTPIVLAIPFKRDSWQMSIEEDFGKNKSNGKVFDMNIYQSKLANFYRKNWWTKKDFS